MNLSTTKTAAALLGLTLGSAVMSAAPGAADAAGDCVFKVNTLTPLDLQERGNGDEINIILDGETFGFFRFRTRSTTPVAINGAVKLFVGPEMTVRLSEDDTLFNQPIGPDKKFDCENETDTVEFSAVDARYEMNYTITEV